MDVKTVADDARRGKCCTRDQNCPLPARLDILIGSFSRKDVSKANMNRRSIHGSNIFSSEHSPGGSSDTFHGCMRLLDRVHPDVVLLENVAELAGDVHGDALDVILMAFNHRGFDTQVFLVNSSDFCLAQTRKRMFILAVLLPGRKIKIDN